MTTGIARDFSFMPMELPDTITAKPVKYEQRMVQYYAHLARLASQELTLSKNNNRDLQFTPYMAMPFTGMRIHAAEMGDHGLLALHQQTTLMQKLIEDIFHLKYEGPAYEVCLQAFEESFRDAPHTLDAQAKVKLSSFSYAFAERMENLVRASVNGGGDGLEDAAVNRRTLPFIRIGWVGEYKEKKPRMPRRSYNRISSTHLNFPINTAIRREIVVPRDSDVVMSGRRSVTAAR
jgi:hypothetical protein